MNTRFLRPFVAALALTLGLAQEVAAPEADGQVTEQLGEQGRLERGRALDPGAALSAEITRSTDSSGFSGANTRPASR